MPKPTSSKTTPKNRKKSKRRTSSISHKTSRSSSSVADCEKKILDAISEGDYKPSQRLGEVSVARELGYGQAIVRSAFDRLADAGVLYRKHRSGTYVRELSTDEYIEMCQVRALLEGYACRLACRYAQDTELDDLEALAKKIDDLTRNHYTKEYFDEIEALDSEFHRTIALLSQNRWIARILSNQQMILRVLRTSISRVQRLGYDLTPALLGDYENIPSHCDIVAGIRSRDAKQADRQMRKHVLEGLRAEMRLDTDLHD